MRVSDQHDEPFNEDDARAMGEDRIEINEQAFRCSQVQPYLHRLVEDELEPLRAAQIQLHLAACPACDELRQELEDERVSLIESLVAMPELSPRFAGKVRQQIEAELAAERAQTRHRWILGLGNAAAMILVAIVLALGAARDAAEPPTVATTPVVVPTATDPATLRGLAKAPTLQPTTPVAHRTLPRMAAPPRHRVRPPADLKTYPRLTRSLPVARVTLPLSHRVRTRPSARRQQQVLIVRGPDGETKAITAPPGARLKRVIVLRGTRQPTHLDVSHVLALADRLGNRPQRRSAAPTDPCHKDDPNHDGITDLKDLAYACQVVLGSGQGVSTAFNGAEGAPQLPGSAPDGVAAEAAESDGTFTESECEEYCLPL